MILNGSVFILWGMLFKFAPDLVWGTQKSWFPLSRESFDVVVYGFLGVIKIFFLVFNVAPYVALRIIA
jgi:hypothetical protein